MNTQTILNRVSLDTVTSEQIGRCHAVIGSDGKTFYQVASESDATVEYQVRYSKEFGFTCTCRSGQTGFSNAKLGVCKHVVWSLACAAEVRTALAEMTSKAEAKKEEEPIEKRWNLPAWMLTAPVAPHMKYSPREI